MPSSPGRAAERQLRIFIGGIEQYRSLPWQPVLRDKDVRQTEGNVRLPIATAETHNLCLRLFRQVGDQVVTQHVTSE